MRLRRGVDRSGRSDPSAHRGADLHRPSRDTSGHRGRGATSAADLREPAGHVKAPSGDQHAENEARQRLRPGEGTGEAGKFEGKTEGELVQLLPPPPPPPVIHLHRDESKQVTAADSKRVNVWFSREAVSHTEKKWGAERLTTDTQTHTSRTSGNFLPLYEEIRLWHREEEQWRHTHTHTHTHTQTHTHPAAAVDFNKSILLLCTVVRPVFTWCFGDGHTHGAGSINLNFLCFQVTEMFLFSTDMWKKNITSNFKLLFLFVWSNSCCKYL